jgi:serine/threonine protein kinase/Tfp pilus assembly protein PilF
MNAPEPPISGSPIPALEDPRVIAAMEEYQAALEAGRAPDRQAFLDRYPDVAPVLAECLEGLAFVHQMNPHWQPSAEDCAGAAPPAGDIWPEGPLGDFRIIREVGRGGMGVVYEAVQISLGRRVALKVLPFAAALDTRQLQRFKNEAQAAAHLHHTNIVPVFGVGCERGVHFYAMQFIEGQTLAALIRELRLEAGKSDRGSRIEDRGSKAGVEVATIEDCGPRNETRPRHVRSSILDPRSSIFRTVAIVGVQAAQALEHAHQQGIIHRDIKPANLLVDPGGRLWITDFGLAQCQSQSGLTMTGDLVGTLRYMSPEQALGKYWLLDHRTDLYALGATLYELLTLEPVFQGRDREEILRQIVSEEPLRPKHWNKAIPAELETIVLKALEKEPRNRYANARDLADDLQRFLDDKPIRARRPTLRQRAAKWGRRHRGIVVTGAVAFLVALVLGIFGLVWSNVHIQREHDQAEVARQRAERNLALAMTALEDFCLQRGEDQLPRDPRLDRIDEDFLTRLLRLYEQIDQTNSGDQRVRQAMAAAWGRVGDLRGKLGQYEAARDAYQRSITLCEQVVSALPNDLYHRWFLAANHRGLSYVLEEMGDLRAALAHSRISLEMWTRLAADFPAESDCRRGLADSHVYHGVKLAQQGDRAKALPHYQKALALRTQLDTDFAGNPQYRHDLAGSYHDLGLLFREMGQRDQAEEHLRRALELGRRLVAQCPDTALYRQGLALIYRALGEITGERSRAAGEQDYGRALDLQQRLVADFPSVPVYRVELADTHNSLGILAGEHNDLRVAEDHFRQALALRARLVADYPTIPRFRLGLSSSHLNFGKRYLGAQNWAAAEHHYRQALDLQTQLARDYPTVPRYRNELAITHENQADLLESTGDWKKAEVHYGQAVSLWDQLATGDPTVPVYRSELALAEELLGNLVCAAGKEETAQNHFRRARDLWTELTDRDVLEGATARTLDAFAHFLASCPAEPFRDVERAVTLARRAVDRAPTLGKHWSTLGLTLYRLEDPKGAIAALEKARQLRKGMDAGDGFLFAMAYARLGETEQARHWYDQAVASQDKDRTERVHRLHAEAGRLVGTGGDTPPRSRGDGP